MTNQVRSLAIALLLCGFEALVTPSAHAEIDLEFRPLKQQVIVGDVAYLGVYAVSDNGKNQSIGAMNVILLWDPAKLELTSFGGGDYVWLVSWFPDDSALDGLNFPFEGPDKDPLIFIPDNDGDALYDCWSDWAGPAWATPEGLLVMTFGFRALATGGATVEILPSYGVYSRTRVMHGKLPGQEVTGVIGPPAEVNVIACVAPSVEGEGSRYLTAIPDAGDEMVAILVTGEAQEPVTGCISLYVQPNGRLGSTPVYQSPAQWDTVHITDTQIIPGASYEVRVDCNPDEPGADLSLAATATSWVWGDVNNDGFVDTDDVLLVLDAAQGVFAPGVTIPNVDLAGCQPNGQVDVDDILFVLDAVQGIGFACPEICEEEQDLDDFVAFHACLAGPGIETEAGCEPFDFDNDNDVDLEDFSRFENAFAE